MPNVSPLELLSEMKEKFENNELLMQAIVFALEVDNWENDSFSADVWTYTDQFNIERGLDKRQYLLTMLKNVWHG
jgi:hypothetical protein